MRNIKINWWKFGVVVAALAAAFFLGKCNERRAWTKQTGIDTIIHKDTNTQKYKPVPYKVVEHDTIPGKPVPYAVHDTTSGQDVITFKDVDTVAILEDCLRKLYGTAYYDDTVKLKRGMARILDTVTQNRIAGRQVQVFNADTTITKAVVLTQPKRTIVYFSMYANGNRFDIVTSAGGGFSIKNKKDYIYGINIGRVRIWSGEVKTRTVYGLEFKLPIHLFKK